MKAINRAYFDAELRVEGEGEATKIVGYAARFNVWSSDLGGFREMIEPGAFRDSLGKDEVFALWNHDSSKPFARTGNGTLKLDEDAKGLRMEATPDETSWGRDALNSVKAGTVYRTSFGFRIENRAKDQEWNGDFSERKIKRAQLFDVSPVTYPAYKQTRISARSASLAELAERLSEGERLSEAEVRFLQSEVPRLTEPEPAPFDATIISRNAARLRLAMAK